MWKNVWFLHIMYFLFLCFKQMVNDRGYIVLCFTLCSLWRTIWQYLPKYKMCKTFDSADPLLGSCPTERPKHMLNALQNKLFIVELFLIAES